MNCKRAKVLVRGRVQGVFFRESTKTLAAANGVSGWIRNLQDGRVEALLEGSEEQIQRVILFMKTGPEQARVDDLEVTFEDYSGEFDDFIVLRR